MLTIVVTSVFEKDGKYYPQIFLDECLYKILKCCSSIKKWYFWRNWQMTNVSKECILCHCWYFKDIGFKF